MKVIASVREVQNSNQNDGLGTLEVRIVEHGAITSRGDIMHIKMDDCFMNIWAGEKQDVEDLITVLEYALILMEAPKDEGS